MKSLLWLTLSVTVLALGGGSARGQQQSQLPKIGVLMNGSMTSPEGIKYREAFMRGFRELGYAEGKNIALEYRAAERKADRLAGLAAELAASTWR